PLGRLFQTRPPEDVPGTPRHDVEGAQDRLEGPAGDQSPGRRRPSESDERRRLDVLENKGIRDDHGEGPLSHRAADRLPEVQVTAARIFPFTRFRVEDERRRLTLGPGHYVRVNRWAYRFHSPKREDLGGARAPTSFDRFRAKRAS